MHEKTENTLNTLIPLLSRSSILSVFLFLFLTNATVKCHVFSIFSFGWGGELRPNFIFFFLDKKNDKVKEPWSQKYSYTNLN
jgi:hypothetical protein